MHALDGPEIEQRLADLAAGSPDASVYCVDAIGARFVDLVPAASSRFKWTVSAATPIELMAESHRVDGAELFVASRRDGSASGVVRMADDAHTDVVLTLLNAGDTVIGVISDAPAPAVAAPLETPASDQVIAPASDQADVDLPEVDLPEADLPEADLPEVDLPEVDLPEVDLPAADAPMVDTSSAAEVATAAAAVATASAVSPAPNVELPEVDLPDVDLREVDLPDVDPLVVESSTAQKPNADPLEEHRPPPPTPEPPSVKAAPDPSAARVVAVTDRAERLILHLNAQGHIVDIDAAAVRVFGRSRDQLVGRPLTALVYPEDERLHRTSWGVLIATDGEERRLRCRYLRSDGTVMWVDQHDKNALRSPTNAIVTELVDITPAVHAAQQSTFEAALAEHLSSSDTSTGVAYLTADRRILFANQRWGIITGLGSEAPFYEFLGSTTDAHAVETSIARALSYGEPGESVITLRGVNNVAARRAKLLCRPMEDPHGEPGVLIALDEIPQVQLNTSGQPEARRQRGAGAGPTAPQAAAAPTVEVPTANGRATGLSGSVTESSAAGAASVTPPTNRAPSPDQPDNLGAPTAERTRLRAQPTGSRKATERSTWSSFWGSDSTAAVDTAEATVAAPSWPRSLVWLAALATAALAAALRLFDLSTLPAGGLAAEQATINEANRIVDAGEATTYSLVGLGQPSGPLYALGWVSDLFSGVSDALTNARLVSVIVGVATVLALFALARRWFDPLVATAASFVLATMLWHIHYSRLALGAIWWPLLFTLALFVLQPALPDRRNILNAADAQPTLGPWWRWLGGGLLLGTGVWAANAHWLILYTVIGSLIGWLLMRGRGGAAGGFGRVFVFGAAAIGIAAPVGLRLLDDSVLINRFDAIDARVTSASWDGLSIVGQFGRVISWWGQTWWELLADPQLESTDALGSAVLVSYVATLLAVVGLMVLLVRHWSAAAWIVVAVLLVAPFASALTTDRLLRHELVLAPLIALLAGLGAAWVLRTLASGFGKAGRLVGLLVAVALVALIGWSTVAGYFDVFANDPNVTALVGG